MAKCRSVAQAPWVVSVRTGQGTKCSWYSGSSSPVWGKAKPWGGEGVRDRAWQTTGHTSGRPQGNQSHRSSLPEKETGRKRRFLALLVFR
jgi:hypothetical protein